MTRILLRCISLLFFFSTGSLFAEMEYHFEIRSAAFFHSSKLFREIYGKVGADFQIQASAKLSDNLEAWTNLDWFSKRGRSIGFNDPTRVEIANYSLGVNFLYSLNCRFTLYLGTGPSLGTIWLKNRSHCRKNERHSKTVIGGVAKAGIYWLVTDRFFVDLFIDYLYQPVHFRRHVNIGGIKPGIGLGINF